MNGVKTFSYGSVELLLQSETCLNVAAGHSLVKDTIIHIPAEMCSDIHKKKERKEKQGTQLTER